jgi:hypothetical protein
MEEEAGGPLKRQDGVALVVVLMAIVILLPPTLILATLALRWQRQSIDLRDAFSEELAARAAFGEARGRLALGSIEMEPRESRSFDPQPIERLQTRVRISRSEDIVLTAAGRILEGPTAQGLDVEQTGIDPEGRVVYQYRRLEVYLVEVDVSRRPSLAAVRLYGVLARLPEGTVRVLGVTLDRRFDSRRAPEAGN